MQTIIKRTVITKANTMPGPLKPLTQHNLERLHASYEQVDPSAPRLNGIACPECESELFDSCPNMTLTSHPPQKNIHCSCGYRGYRYL